MKEKVTRWWWVRHAPVLGMEGVLYGDDDVSCDTTNTMAFESLAQMLPKEAYWVTSHLSRTLKTADAIRVAGLDFPQPVIESGIGEQNFGGWQGLTWKQMEARDPEAYFR